MALISRSLEKHMRRSPIPDEDIQGALFWAQEMIQQVLTGEQTLIPLIPESAYDELTAPPAVSDPAHEDSELVIPAHIPAFEPADETAD